MAGCAALNRSAMHRKIAIHTSPQVFLTTQRLYQVNLLGTVTNECDRVRHIGCNFVDETTKGSI